MYSVVTIGNFDGCHLGHQSLIKKTIAISKEYDITPAAITFDPHPDDFFNTQYKVPKLMSKSQKIDCLKWFGISEINVIEFNDNFSRMSAEDFFEKILIQKMQAKHIVVGESFRFGQGRKGDVELLRKLSKTKSVSIHAIQDSEFDNEAISSSRIRNILQRDGNAQLASKLLGKPYFLEGVVKSGKQLGRTIGFPTANLENITQLLPLKGVYAAVAVIQNNHSSNYFESLDLLRAMNEGESLSELRAFSAMVNIGYRPTTQNTDSSLTVEAHLLGSNFSESELYESSMSLYFISRLRDEIKFSSMEDLKSQLHKDKLKTEQEICDFKTQQQNRKQS